MPQPAEIERTYTGLHTAPATPSEPFRLIDQQGSTEFSAAYFPYGSDKLVVSFHGAVDRTKHTLPIYARWDWGKRLNANLLCISDPTLSLDPSLRIGWYTGTATTDVMKCLVTFITEAIDHFKFEPSKSTMFGSSAGGFAALMVGSKISGVNAFAINPQTRIWKYKQSHVAEYMRVFGSDLEAHSNRTSLFSSLQAADLGSKSRFAIMQNRTDWHYEEHFIPLRGALKFGPLESTSPGGRFKTLTYDVEGGHDATPPSIIGKSYHACKEFFEQPR